MTNQKSAFKKFFSGIFSFFIFILILAGVFYLAKSTFLLYLKNRESRKSFSETKSELEKLKEEKASLEAELKKIETPEGLERMLRERFQAVKPGEHLIIVSEEEPPHLKESLDKSTSTAKKNFFKKFLNFFRRD
jgi:cell division protein FtsB